MSILAAAASLMKFFQTVRACCPGVELPCVYVSEWWVGVGVNPYTKAATKLRHPTSHMYIVHVRTLQPCSRYCCACFGARGFCSPLSTASR